MSKFYTETKSEMPSRWNSFLNCINVQREGDLGLRFGDKNWWRDFCQHNVTTLDNTLSPQPAMTRCPLSYAVSWLEREGGTKRVGPRGCEGWGQESVRGGIKNVRGGAKRV